jgi:hypothetical protein
MCDGRLLIISLGASTPTLSIAAVALEVFKILKSKVLLK